MTLSLGPYFTIECISVHFKSKDVSILGWFWLRLLKFNIFFKNYLIIRNLILF